MPTPTYTPLANITLGSAAATITFGSIPATYRDLVIVFSGFSTPGTLQARIRLNGDTGSNYNYQRMSGSGSSTSATSATSQTFGFISAIAQSFSTSALQIKIDLMDYSATDKHTTIISRADNAVNGTEAFVNRWANTAAVNSVTILPSTGDWATGTNAAIYGIVA
jgi:hypothetical protein